MWDEFSDRAHWPARPASAPFFAVFNYMVTHESRLHPGWAEPLKDGGDPADVRLPAYHPDLPELRADRALYFDQNTRLDAELAARLAELDDDGLAEHTIVFYFGDHGGATPRTKRFCYDLGLRVPLIVYVPERWRHLWPVAPGRRVVDLVNLVDLVSTMLRLAGLETPAYMHGRAFGGSVPDEPPRYTFGFRGRMDARYDVVRTVRDLRYRYIRNFLPHLPHGQHVEYLFRQVGAQVWEREYRAGGLKSHTERVLAGQAGRGVVRPRRRPGGDHQPGRTARVPPGDRTDARGYARSHSEHARYWVYCRRITAG